MAYASSVGLVWREKQKQQNKKPKQHRHTRDVWEKQQSSERKPGLPPARSPEITQSKPHRHKLHRSQAILRLAMTQSCSQRMGGTKKWDRTRVRINNRVSNSQSPLRVHSVGLVLLSASFQVELLLVFLQLIIMSWSSQKCIVLRRGARAFLCAW